MATLTGQAEARLRLALIPLFLAQLLPANSVPAVAAQLSRSARQTLHCFYTAVYLLQQVYAEPFRRGGGAQPALPDLFSNELGIPQNGTLEDRLKALDAQQRTLSGQCANWVGTYQSGAELLLRPLRRAVRWQR
jgi:hypothetical protein